MPTKKSKGRTKSKAALATAEKLGRGGSVGEGEPFKRGGMMSKMRSGFQNAAGVSDQSEPPSIFQRALWFVVLAAAVFFFARGM